MAKTTIDLTVSQLINDLENGKTWYKAEDEGYGSIEETYGAKPHHIALFKTHPKLVGLEPCLVFFTLTDDTKEGFLKVEPKDAPLAAREFFITDDSTPLDKTADFANML